MCHSEEKLMTFHFSAALLNIRPQHQNHERRGETANTNQSELLRLPQSKKQTKKTAQEARGSKIKVKV